MKYSADQYKRFPIYTGVYSISFKNSLNKKRYIGSASRQGKKYNHQNGFNHRWRGHLNHLKNKTHSSKKLQNAYNKYGIQSIEFEILEYAAPSQCIEIEQRYILLTDSCKNGYNSRPVASNQLGFKHSSETKEKFSEKLQTKQKDRENLAQETILHLYNLHIPIRQICLKVNLCKDVVSKILKHHGVNIKMTADYTRKRIWQYNHITNEFIKEWNGIQNCARELNLSESRIRKSIKFSRTYGEFIFYDCLQNTFDKPLIDSII
jgi:group I intron endonuclease